jgi:hypothetical protein
MTQHEELEDAVRTLLRRMHDAVDVLVAISVGSKLLAENLETCEPHLFRLLAFVEQSDDDPEEK